MGELLCEPRRELGEAEARAACEAWVAQWPEADRGPAALAPYLCRTVLRCEGWGATPAHPWVGRTVDEVLAGAARRWADPRLVYAPPAPLVALARRRYRDGGGKPDAVLLGVRVALHTTHPDHGGIMSQVFWFGYA